MGVWQFASSWVMKRLLDLGGDDEFRNTGDPELPGTFLIVSPYKAAIKHYLAEKEKLPASVRRRAEVRTRNSSQGNEADIVIVG